MRISDWSSDVCSSDLLQAHLARHRDGGDGVQRVVASEHRQVQAIQARGMGAAAVGHLDIEGEAAVVDADVLGAVVGLCADAVGDDAAVLRSEEHTSELQSLMRISYAGFCLKKKNEPHSTSTVYKKQKIIRI